MEYTLDEFWEKMVVADMIRRAKLNFEHYMMTE